MGPLVIEPPWWIGCGNLTDSDKRLFGVACSIKQRQRPTTTNSPPKPLPPPPDSSFRPLSAFGLLCCHGDAQPEPSCVGWRGARRGAALRSPDEGRQRGAPFCRDNAGALWRLREAQLGRRRRCHHKHLNARRNFFFHRAVRLERTPPPQH